MNIPEFCALLGLSCEPVEGKDISLYRTLATSLGLARPEWKAFRVSVKAKAFATAFFYFMVYPEDKEFVIRGSRFGLLAMESDEDNAKTIASWEGNVMAVTMKKDGTLNIYVLDPQTE